MIRSSLIAGIAAVVAVALMVACLWTWQQGASQFASDAGRPSVATLAARSAAVALGAASQAVLLTLVVGRFYRRQLIDDMLKLTAAAVMLG